MSRYEYERYTDGEDPDAHEAFADGPANFDENEFWGMHHAEGPMSPREKLFVSLLFLFLAGLAIGIVMFVFAGGMS